MVTTRGANSDSRTFPRSCVTRKEEPKSACAAVEPRQTRTPGLTPGTRRSKWRGAFQIDRKQCSMAQSPGEFRIDRKVEVWRLIRGQLMGGEAVKADQPSGLIKTCSLTSGGACKGSLLDASGIGLTADNKRAAISAAHRALPGRKLDRVISLSHPDNHASRRVTEKNGMTLEKTTLFRGFPAQVFSCTKDVA